MKTIKLPVKIQGYDFNEIEIKAVSTGAVMEAKKSADTGEYFSALKTFIEGAICNFSKEETRKIVANMPIQTAEYIAVEVILLQDNDGDDGVEGVYYCPRCGEQKICEVREEIDNRDFISELEVVYYDEDSFEISKDVDIEIVDRKTKEPILSINNITMRFPLIKDFIQAANKVGYRNEVDIQKQVYIDCISKINGNESADVQKLKNRYGTRIIEQMDTRDLNFFGKYFNQYGLNNKVHKVCNKCGKEWDATLNTSNFFVSALQ